MQHITSQRYSIVFKEAFISVAVIFFLRSKVDKKLNSIVSNGVNRYARSVISDKLPKSISPNTNSIKATPSGIPNTAPIKLII